MTHDPARVRTCRVLEVRRHGPGLASLYTDELFPVHPGQFVNLWLPGVDEKPLSLSDIRDGRFEFTIKAVGPFSRRLVEAGAGDRIGVRGPFGRGFVLRPGGVLVAGGIGVAPLRFLAHALEAAGLPFRFLVGVRCAADLVFAPELTGTALLCSDDGSVGERGTVTRALERALGRGRPTTIYGSGPEAMLVVVRELALRHGGIPVQLSFERTMKCGFGICGQCCMDGSGLRLCVEGPVLTEEQLAQVTDLGLPRRTSSGRRPGAAPATP